MHLTERCTGQSRVVVVVLAVVMVAEVLVIVLAVPVRLVTVVVPEIVLPVVDVTVVVDDVAVPLVNDRLVDDFVTEVRVVTVVLVVVVQIGGHTPSASYALSARLT